MSSKSDMGDNEDLHRSARQMLFMDVIKSNSSNSGSPRTTNAGPTMTKAVEFKAAVIGGCLLSINAGCINAITVMETGVRDAAPVQ